LFIGLGVGAAAFAILGAVGCSRRRGLIGRKKTEISPELTAPIITAEEQQQ
jgi:hypothetical protein